MGEQREVLVDTVAAAAAVEVLPRRVRVWAHRGKLEARGRDEQGRTLYALRDVRRVYREQTNRTRSVDTPRQY